MVKGGIEISADIMGKLKSLIETTIVKALEPIKYDIAGIRSDIAEIKTDIAVMKSNIDELSTRMTAAENEIQHNNQKLLELQNANNNHEQHYRGTCLKIYGLEATLP